MHSALLFFFLFRPAISADGRQRGRGLTLVSLTRSHASASSGSDNVSTRPLLQERFSLLISLSLSSSSLFLFFLFFSLFSLSFHSSFLVAISGCKSTWAFLHSPRPPNLKGIRFSYREGERGGGGFFVSENPYNMWNQLSLPLSDRHRDWSHVKTSSY